MTQNAQSAEHFQKGWIWKTNGFLIMFRSLILWWNVKSYEIIFITYEFCLSGLPSF